MKQLQIITTEHPTFNPELETEHLGFPSQPVDIQDTVDFMLRIEKRRPIGGKRANLLQSKK